jgi:hypothetical protein
MNKNVRAANNKVINALARVERARLNLRLAETGLGEARIGLEEALKKSDPDLLTDHEKGMARSGHKIDAIKSVRNRSPRDPGTGYPTIGLIEAKHAVDAYLARKEF